MNYALDHFDTNLIYYLQQETAILLRLRISVPPVIFLSAENAAVLPVGHVVTSVGSTVAKEVLTTEYREGLQILPNFRFTDHSRYHLPTHRLKLLEYQLQCKSKEFLYS